MPDNIEITSNCDGLRNPHPDGEKLCGVGVGSVLLLLRDDDRDYYKVAFGGQPVFVPKSCGRRVESEETREYDATVREREPASQLERELEPEPAASRDEAMSGAPNEETCLSCGQSAPADAEFCPNCGKSLMGRRQDVVGAGRYILNFLLAGFIGLGLSFFLRRRGWLATWMSLPIFVLVIIVSVVLVVVAVVQEVGEVNAFVEELDEITLDYNAEYVIPVSRAALLLETDCRVIEPDPAVADCDAFMETLTEADARQVRVINRLKSLRQRIPESVPADVDTLLAGMIRVLELDHESNEVLADGWYQQDPAKWQEGWELSLQAAIEGLDFAENAIRIAERLQD